MLTKCIPRKSKTNWAIESSCANFVRLWQRILVIKKLTENFYGKHYFKVWSSKRLTIKLLRVINNSFKVISAWNSNVDLVKSHCWKNTICSDVVLEKLEQIYNVLFPFKSLKVTVWSFTGRFWSVQDDMWISWNYDNKK